MPTVYDYGLMANAVYENSPSVQGWACPDFRASLGSGLQAAVFTRGQKTVAAFKGTTPTQGSDLVADLKIGVGMNTSYFSEAEEFVSRYANTENLVVTGHSLGGAIAQVVGNRRQIPFVSFNAPGVALMASRNIATATPHMAAIRMAGGLLSALRHPMQTARDIGSALHVSLGVNYRLSSDVVSTIGLHYGDVVSLQSSADVLDQHSMDTMQEVLGNAGYRNIEFPA